MRQTRFVFGLEELMAFTGIIGKKVDNVGEQAINLLFARLLDGEQRFEGFQWRQQSFQQFAVTSSAGLK
ncbi:hypothetical protein D3C86_1764740 [compost metagenome]